MSYQVFSRKYRPQTFEDVLGQEPIVRTLCHSFDQDRLAHAYLFTGPRGTGKTSLARILAKALNHSKGPSKNFDPLETICQEIGDGRCLDVLEIDGASNNGVDQVRELRYKASGSPAQCPFKIYYIDEVHMLSTAAFNALLKTLEEPPAHIKFIFATTEPQKILSTIISRCQRFDLRPISQAVIVKQLLNIASLEGLSLSEPAANLVAQSAQGDMRDAQSMLDQLVSFCGKSINEDQVLEVFGITSERTLATLLESMLNQNISEIMELIASQNQAGKSLSELMHQTLKSLRDLLLYKLNGKPLEELTYLETDIWQPVIQKISHLSLEKLLNLIHQLAETEGKLRWSNQKQLALEIGFIRSVQNLSQVSLSDIIESLEEPNKLPPASTTAPILASKAVPVSTPLNLQEGWNKLLEICRDQKPLMADWLALATPLERSENTLLIGLPLSEKFAKDSLIRQKSLSFLEEQLTSLFKTKTQLKIELRKSLKSPLPPTEPIPETKEILTPQKPKSPITTKESPLEKSSKSEDPFYKDPLIQAALEIFNGKIIN